MPLYSVGVALAPSTFSRFFPPYCTVSESFENATPCSSTVSVSVLKVVVSKVVNVLAGSAAAAFCWASEVARS